MAFETLKSPVLGLGCWVFGNAAPDSPQERTALEVMREALTLGVRNFDTAQDYGNGRSETLVGRALAGHPEAFIATKMHLTDPVSFVRKLEESRTRLNRDVIDLFYIHWPKTGLDCRPMMEALENERNRGRIRFIGVSNFEIEDLERARESGVVDVYQAGFNLLWRSPEKEILPYCRKNRISLVAYSSLAQGLLTGKFPAHPHFEPGDPRPETVFYGKEVWPSVFEALESMKTVAENCGLPLSHLALRWLTDLMGVDLVLVGARSSEQLNSNLAFLSCVIPEGVLQRLDQISADLVPQLPALGNMFKFQP